MTTDELLRLMPDEGLDRWLFAGRLVERWNGNGFHSPGHAAATATVGQLLGNWCRAQGSGFRGYGYACPYHLARDPDTVVSFDASVVRTGRAGVGELYIDATPLLAVEVVELDEDEGVLAELVTESLRCGVGVVWVVNPFEELVTQYTATHPPLYVNGRMELSAEPVLPGFRCRVAEIFE